MTKQAINDKSSDKYRWHDLRKNPNDLPTDNERKIVLVEWSNSDREYFTDYFMKYSKWVNDNMSCNGTVIAWKEIEPFEVEE